jgi:hypothetical protein
MQAPRREARLGVQNSASVVSRRRVAPTTRAIRSIVSRPVGQIALLNACSAAAAGGPLPASRLAMTVRRSSNKATCAAIAIASLLSDETAGYPPTQALQVLSGHLEWTPAQLGAWAKQQPSNGIR